MNSVSTDSKRFDNDVLYQRLSSHLNTTLFDLRQDLLRYQSWVGNSRPHEANLTFHLARVARNSGLLFYPEIPIENFQENDSGESEEASGRRQAFDGLILDLAQKRAVIVESKCLFSGSVTSVNADIRRMHGEKPNRFETIEPNLELTDGLLLLHTADRAVWEWWAGDFATKHMPGRKNVEAAWLPCRHLLQNGVSGGGYILKDNQENYRDRWMLWVMFPLEFSSISAQTQDHESE